MSDTGRARVLIVEDNIDNYELVRFLLERAGYDSLWAHSGREGIDMVKSGRPDLILMDLSLPEMDGWTATERLKADEETRSIPIIALTAHTLPGDRKRALEVGCDGFLSKPIDLALFNSVIEEALAKAAGKNKRKLTGGLRL
jgi:two-component system, cell cycle response regulator DivK